MTMTREQDDDHADMVNDGKTESKREKSEWRGRRSRQCSSQTIISSSPSCYLYYLDRQQRTHNLCER